MPTVSTGNTISSAHFNDIATRVNRLYGTGTSDYGYGQTALGTVSSVSTGGSITVANYNTARSLARIVATHLNYTTTFDTLWTTFTSGSVITATQTNNIETAIAYLENNRYSALNTAGYTTNTSVLTMTRTGVWSTGIYGEFKVEWASEDLTRHFFNTGGAITLSFSQPGATSFDTNVNTSMSNVGVIYLTPYSYDNGASVGSGTGGGFYNMTSNTVNDGTVRFDANDIGTSFYVSTDIQSSLYRLNYVGTNGGNGRTIIFRFAIYEQHNNVYFDQVSSGTVAYIGTRRATSTGLTTYPTAPTITIQSNW